MESHKHDDDKYGKSNVVTQKTYTAYILHDHVSSDDLFHLYIFTGTWEAISYKKNQQNLKHFQNY